MKMWQVNYLQIAIPSVPCLNLGNSNRHQREDLDFKNMKIGAILDWDLLSLFSKFTNLQETYRKTNAKVAKEKDFS